MADRLSPGESIVGKRLLLFGREPAEVVGIAGPVKYRALRDE